MFEAGFLQYECGNSSDAKHAACRIERRNAGTAVKPSSF